MNGVDQRGREPCDNHDFHRTQRTPESGPVRSRFPDAHTESSVVMGRLSSKHLDDITPFGEVLYSNVDLTGLAAFTIHWLQERQIPTTFENIVVAAFRMFPTKFALEGYRDYPDAARVNRTLLQLRPKYRNWARGSVQKGFILTESGLAKVATVREGLESGLPTSGEAKHKRPSAPRTMDISSELAQLERSELHLKWTQGRLDEATSMELFDMLGAFAYTPPRAMRDRISLLENAASQLARGDLVQFLRSVRKTFEAHFKDS